MFFDFGNNKTPNFTYKYGYYPASINIVDISSGWNIDSSQYYSYPNSFRSAPIYSQSYSSVAEIVADYSGYIAFNYKVTGVNYWDYFYLVINGGYYIAQSYTYENWYYSNNIWVNEGDLIQFVYIRSYYGNNTFYSYVYIDNLTLPVLNKYTYTSTAQIVCRGNSKINTKKYTQSVSNIISPFKNYIYIKGIDSLDYNEFIFHKRIRVFNLSNDKLDAIQVHIEPKILNANLNQTGYNELINGPWLFSEYNLSLVIDDVPFNIKTGHPGISTNNPIIFRRSDYENKKEDFLFGNNSTLVGTDWMKHINYGNNNNITSLPSSGNILDCSSYFLSDVINHSSTKYVSIDIFYRKTVSDIITKILKDYNICISYPLYNKNISNNIGILYGDENVIVNNYNVRW